MNAQGLRPLVADRVPVRGAGVCGRRDRRGLRILDYSVKEFVSPRPVRGVVDGTKAAHFKDPLARLVSGTKPPTFPKIRRAPACVTGEAVANIPVWGWAHRLDELPSDPSLEVSRQGSRLVALSRNSPEADAE